LKQPFYHLGAHCECHLHIELLNGGEKDGGHYLRVTDIIAPRFLEEDSKGYSWMAGTELWYPFVI
jgi:hypothetical protein